MCKVLGVSRNAYYRWKRNGGSKKKEPTRKDLLKQHIESIYDQSYQTYGSHRIAASLQKEGKKVSRSYVARLMKEMGLKSVLRKKFKVTTDSNHGYKVADNLLERNFSSLQLGQVWVSDITYIKVGNSWAYLTVIIDLADRKVVGWSLSRDLTAENTVLKAYFAARRNRKVMSGFIFHSDRGIQYACNKTKAIFSFHLKGEQSMSRKGDCWDNAVAESFFKTIKYEMIYRQHFTCFNQLYQQLWEYIENWYNTKRLHSALGYRSPLEMEVFLKTSNNIKNVA